jgi:general stress protein 26
MYQDSHVAELSAKIKSLRFAMFTTQDQHGHLTSHPMTAQQLDPQGALWFHTSTQANLWENIAHAPEVNISFSDPSDSLFVSVSGRAERVVERSLIEAMWNPGVQAWFPNGPQDEHLVLVKVVPHLAEYWGCERQQDGEHLRHGQVAVDRRAAAGRTGRAWPHSAVG